MEEKKARKLILIIALIKAIITIVVFGVLPDFLGYDSIVTIIVIGAIQFVIFMVFLVFRLCTCDPSARGLILARMGAVFAAHCGVTLIFVFTPTIAWQCTAQASANALATLIVLIVFHCCDKHYEEVY